MASGGEDEGDGEEEEEEGNMGLKGVDVEGEEDKNATLRFFEKGAEENRERERRAGIFSFFFPFVMSYEIKSKNRRL